MLYPSLVKESMQNADDSKSWLLKNYLLGVEKNFCVLHLSVNSMGSLMPLCLCARGLGSRVWGGSEYGGYELPGKMFQRTAHLLKW